MPIESARSVMQAVELAVALQVRNVLSVRMIRFLPSSMQGYLLPQDLAHASQAHTTTPQLILASSFLTVRVRTIS